MFFPDRDHVSKLWIGVELSCSGFLLLAFLVSTVGLFRVLVLGFIHGEKRFTKRPHRSQLVVFLLCMLLSAVSVGSETLRIIRLISLMFVDVPSLHDSIHIISQLMTTLNFLAFLIAYFTSFSLLLHVQMMFLYLCAKIKVISLSLVKFLNMILIVINIVLVVGGAVVLVCFGSENFLPTEIADLIDKYLFLIVYLSTSVLLLINGIFLAIFGVQLVVTVKRALLQRSVRLRAIKGLAILVITLEATIIIRVFALFFVAVLSILAPVWMFLPTLFVVGPRVVVIWACIFVFDVLHKDQHTSKDLEIPSLKTFNMIDSSEDPEGPPKTKSSRTQHPQPESSPPVQVDAPISEVQTPSTPSVQLEEASTPSVNPVLPEVPSVSGVETSL